MSEKRSFYPNRSGIDIKEVYGTANESNPGEFPFTRGVQKNMYRGRWWTMRQYAGFGTAEESNQRYRYLLSQGTMGLSVAFDLPTQLGLDPDHPRANGEVGKVGVSIATIEDMETLFKGIDLSQVSTSMTINATAPILLALYVAVAEKSNVSPKCLRGTVQNDVLKEYIARGNYIYPPDGALRLATDLFQWCAQETPKWNPISISGYHIREAGSTAVQELAFTFANAIAYVEAALARGLKIDDFAGQLSFFFNVHNDFFEEIAKFRAARKIWAKIVRDRFKSHEPRSQMLRFHSQTAGSTLTAQQPMNNVVRVTLQALASVLGGTQSLHTNGMDEALSLPTEGAAKLALRTQQVIAYESNVTQTVDPLGGSVFVEELTAQIEKKVFEYLEVIEKKGGTISGILNGFQQNEIASSAYLAQRHIDQGLLGIVGVNVCKEKEETSVPLQKIRPEVQAEAIQKIQAFKKKRSDQSVQAALKSLKDKISAQENLMEGTLCAVKSGATLGEIAQVFGKEFGYYQGHKGY